MHEPPRRRFSASGSPWGTALRVTEWLSAAATLGVFLLPRAITWAGGTAPLLQFCWTTAVLAAVFLSTILLAVLFRLLVFTGPRLLIRLAGFGASLLKGIQPRFPAGPSGT